MQPLAQNNLDWVVCPYVETAPWPFLALCAYFLSQAFTIPIAAIGPSWALWPTLGDVCCWFLIAAALLSNADQRFTASHKQRTLSAMLAVVVSGCVISFLMHQVWRDGPSFEQASSQVALYQVYRLLQFTLLFWAAKNISLSPKRIYILGLLLPWVLIIVCGGLILEFVGSLDISIFVAHLPREPGVAGAWSTYIGRGHLGRGTISYDHAYSSAQVLLLLALVIHLRRSRSRVLCAVLTVVAIIAIWTTGCRAVEAGSLVFLIGLYSRHLFSLAKIMVVTAVTVGFVAICVPRLFTTISEAVGVERRIGASYDGDGLGGREEIWKRRLDFLGEPSAVWLIGGGPGSDTTDHGNAHNLYLEILLEYGGIGLIIFLWVFGFILVSLYRSESPPKAVFWATNAILVASMAQVTFYPIPWTGHFIAFYLCTIAVVLRRTSGTRTFGTPQYRFRVGRYPLEPSQT